MSAHVGFAPDSSPAAAFFETPIPAHDEPPAQRVPSTILHAWPEGTFVENLHACDDGSFVVSVHSERRLLRWSEAGGVSVLAELPASPTAINVHPDGGFVVLGGTVARSPGFVWHVRSEGSYSELLRIDDALFLNGGTPFIGSRLLAVDSLLGRIYEIDLAARVARVWFDHDLLRKVSAEPMLPGANGVKIFGRHVYVSNTDRALFLRVAIEENGSAGSLEVVAERLRADDFAFDVRGVAYLATHIHNSVLRLDPSGGRSNVGVADDGLAGSTAVAFGRSADDAGALYVSTTGGVLAPIDGRAQPARLVRLAVGVVGFPIAYGTEDDPV